MLSFLARVSTTPPRWSPDGRWIAFLSDRKNPVSNAPGSVFSMKIEKPEAAPDAVRDKGQKANPDEMQLWLMPATGGEATPLTDLPGGVKQLVWSPDGKTIAFVRRDQHSTRVNRTSLQRCRIRSTLSPASSSGMTRTPQSRNANDNA